MGRPENGLRKTTTKKFKILNLKYAESCRASSDFLDEYEMFDKRDGDEPLRVFRKYLLALLADRRGNDENQQHRRYQQHRQGDRPPEEHGEIAAG